MRPSTSAFRTITILLCVSYYFIIGHIFLIPIVSTMNQYVGNIFILLKKSRYSDFMTGGKTHLDVVGRELLR